MMNNNIEIIFMYCQKDTQKWDVYQIDVYEYYDIIQLDPGEKIEVDSIPIHNQLLDYLPISIKCNIRKIKVELIDHSIHEKIVFFQVFWNDQNNWCLDRKDYKMDVIDYHEMILSSVVPPSILKGKKTTYEIARIVNNVDEIECVYHGFIFDNADGSQGEILLSD